MKLFVDRILYVCVAPIATVARKETSGADANKRIVNGYVSHSRPFYVKVFTLSEQGKKSICGGTLIAPNIVLLATHCFLDFGYFPLKAFDKCTAAHFVFLTYHQLFGNFRANLVFLN